MASQSVAEHQPTSAATESPRRKLLPIVILTVLAIAGCGIAWYGYPQLAAPILGLPAAYEVLCRLRPTPPSGTNVKKRNPILRRRIYVAALVLFIYGVGYLTSVSAYAYRQPRVWLDIPNANLESTVDVVLHWKNLKTGQRPGVFLYSASDRRFYPAQCGVASESGMQPCRIDIGLRGDHGKTFELLPSLLSPNGEVVIKQYRADPTAAGMIEPPDGTSLFRSKMVIRKD